MKRNGEEALIVSSSCPKITVNAKIGGHAEYGRSRALIDISTSVDKVLPCLNITLPIIIVGQNIVVKAESLLLMLDDLNLDKPAQDYVIR